MANWINGIAFKDIEPSETGLPVIKIAEIKGGISGQTKFTRKVFDESVRLHSGDLLFSWSGAPETSIDAFWWRGPEGWLNQHIFKVVPKSGVDMVFFHYLLRYLKPNFINIARNKQTTGLGHVTKKDLEDMLVAYPEIPEQKTIAGILGALDDKIELNRRANETLEAMARAIFKDWFVDFGPVHAKAALRHEVNHSPLEGESARQGQRPQPSRWGEIKRQYAADAQTHARALRKVQTDAEGLLWRYLRNKQLDGYKFRRQQPIGKYIVDFACMPRKLIVEVDGGQHDERRGYDQERDAWLQERGYQVLRFWNNEVMENCFGVLERIWRELRGSQIPPTGSTAGKALVSPTPPQGGSGVRAGGWTVEQARAYLDQMDPEIAALFPDRLVDSEIGEVPEGWAVHNLLDIADRVSDKYKRPEEWKDENLIDLGRMPRSSISLFEHGLGEELSTSITRFKKMDFLFGSIRPYFRKAGIAPFDGVSNSSVFVVRGKSDSSRSYVYCYLSSDLLFEKAIQHSKGTKMPAIGWRDLFGFKFCYPSTGVADAFHQMTSPMFEKIVANAHENAILAEIRDALLPKLISGELRASDIEGAIE